MKKDFSLYDLVFKDGYYEVYVLIVCIMLYTAFIDEFVVAVAFNGFLIIVILSKYLINKIFNYKLKIRWIATLWLFFNVYAIWQSNQ